MEKEIKEFVEALKVESEEGWNQVDLASVEAPTSFHVIAMDRTVAYADENDLLIFINNSGVKKTNAQLDLECADFDYDNEELLNEFKDEVYGEIENAIAELGGKSIASSPEEDEFIEECIKNGIPEAEISSFSTMERFHLLYKF